MQSKKYYRVRDRRESFRNYRLKPPDRALAWFKEWSGVITALIAILYTFPFDATSKLKDFWNKDVIEARATISKIAELNAEKILAVSKLQNSDAKTSAFLAGTYDIRIYNAVVNDKDLFARAMNSLSASELYSAGSALVLSGFIKESYPLYQKSLDKSRSDNPSVYVAALREYGLAMVTRPNMLNVPEARKKYIEALNVIADKRNGLDPFTYAVDYAELSISELMYGDWACGAIQILGALDIFEKLKQSSLQNPAVVASTEEYFRSAASKKSKYPGQAENGCDYKIPPIEISN